MPEGFGFGVSMFFRFKSCLTALVLALTSGTGPALANEINFENLGYSPYGNPGWVTEVTVALSGQERTVDAGVYRLVDTEKRLMVEAFCLNVHGCNSPTGDFSVWNWLPRAVQKKINLLYAQSYDDVRDSRSAAAFQVALWEVVTDSAMGLDLSSGHFTAQGRGYAYMLAETFIDRLLTNQSADGAMVTFTAAGEGVALVGTTIPFNTARTYRRKRRV